MTSVPVTAGNSTCYAGAKTAAVPANTDTDISFSEIFKNQKSEGMVSNPEKSAQPKQKPKAEDVVKPVNREEVSAKETETANVSKTEGKDVKEAVEAESKEAAEKMLDEVADELGMTTDEVMEILAGLNMVPADLLNVENLQTVLLQAAGEVDLSSFVTNEELFTSLKNLTAALDDIISEVAETVGIPETEVAELFNDLLTDTVKGEDAQPDIGQLAESVIQENGDEIEGVTKEDGLPMKRMDATEESSPKNAQETNVETTEVKAVSEDTAAQNGSLSGNENPFLQQTESFAVKDASFVQATEAPNAYFSEDTLRIMNQITDYMKGQVMDGVSELEMQLHPESLGSLHIKLTAKDGALTAQFTAQNDMVKNVLESQMISLKENFKEQGVTVDAIEVTVESHKFDESFNEEHGEGEREQNQNSARSFRRINLNLDSLDFDTEELTREEQLAAEMLRENGGTVDYTA